METSEILNALAAKYRLPITKVHDALTLVLSGEAFRHATKAHFGELTEEGVLVYRDNGFQLLGHPKRPLSRILTHELERILTDANTAVELEQWERLRRQIMKARVERIDRDGTVNAVLEILGPMGEVAGEVIGRCTVGKQSPRDRETLRPGQSKYFYVEKVEAHRHGTAPATISIDLSRVVRCLPEYLLRRELKGRQVDLHCTKRVVGRVSYIDAKDFIPKAIITAVGKELGERVKVEVERKKIGS